MSHTFLNQSLLRITLDTGIDISTATTVKVLFKKPDGTKSEWIGSISETTKVLYDLQVGDIDALGTWILQSYVLMGGREGYGDHVYVTVKENFD